MRISYTFRHMDASNGLKEHTAHKLERISRFEDREMSVHVTFDKEKYQKMVEFQVNGAHGTFVCTEKKDDMYEAIDLAIDKLDRQLSREKSKRKNHHKH
jgi:putative sigma-54 modulation protein